MQPPAALQSLSPATGQGTAAIAAPMLLGAAQPATVQHQHQQRQGTAGQLQQQGHDVAAAGHAAGHAVAGPAAAAAGRRHSRRHGNSSRSTRAGSGGLKHAHSVCFARRAIGLHRYASLVAYLVLSRVATASCRALHSVYPRHSYAQ